MSKIIQFDLNIEQVSKLNGVLPKGYKVISVEENIKRLALIKDKPQVAQVPISETKIQEPINRRNKNNASYSQEENEQTNKPRSDFEFEKTKMKKDDPKNIPSEKPKQSHEMEHPPLILPVNQLSSKEVLEKLSLHPKFYVFENFEIDHPSKCTYNALVAKVQIENYSIIDLICCMRNIFIELDGVYCKNLEILNDSAELETYFSSLVKLDKAKVRELKKERGPIKEESFIIPSINKQQSSQLPKKKTVSIKSEIKQITIMEKRILGQNIKKLPNECLGEICRIVFETLETREEYVIDIDTLPHKKIKELQTYVNNCRARFVDIEEANEERNEADSTEENFVIEDDSSF